MRQKIRLPHYTRYLAGSEIGLGWLNAVVVNDYVAARHLNWHRHDDCEIIFPIRGRYQYEFDGNRSLGIDHNSCLIIPKGVRHRLSESIDAPGLRFSLHLKAPSARIGSGGAVSAREYRELYAMLSARSLRGIAVFPGPKSPVGLLAKLAASNGAELSELEKIRARILCCQILLDGATAEPAQTAPPAKDILSKATQWIERNFTRPVTLDELIGFIGYSRARFFTLFKQFHGMTPCEYLRRRRIERARELLATTERPAAQIARDCGFGDSAHFSRLFLKMTAQTPLAYRRSAKAGMPCTKAAGEAPPLSPQPSREPARRAIRPRRKAAREGCRGQP